MIKQTMTSPFTGGVATLHSEPSSLVFRKETFYFIHQFYECQDTHERFTTTEIDEANMAQVYNQYRAKYGIPFPEEIKRIRQHYALSATKMSEILGFGENQYRLYENGDMPSEANGKVLMSGSPEQLAADERCTVVDRIQIVVRIHTDHAVRAYA